MSEIIWATDAEENDIYAPDTDKQKSGWGAEQPPYQYMNWLQNRTDTRLGDLEKPWNCRVVVDENTDGQTSGSEYETPTYYVGTDSIQVYIGDVLARKDDSYSEVGATFGMESTSITWNQDIEAGIPISVFVKAKADDTAYTLTESELEDLIVSVVKERFGIDEA